MTIDLQTLKTAIDGAAAAFRCVTDYQPAGGPGDKVFPPTYEGGKYATEERIDPETGERRPCVLLDSVQSQANRMELALLEAHRAEKVELPLLVTRFNQEELLRKFTVTSLEAPRGLLQLLADLPRLAAKVTHVGHSASFVQVWLESDDAPHWTLNEQDDKRKLKTGRPSEANHSNIPPTITEGGFTISKARQTTTPFPARRCRGLRPRCRSGRTHR